MSRLAAIDCGTNSIRLLIADVDKQGRATEVLRTMQIVRLGQGVDATGTIHPDAIARTRKALSEFVSLMIQENVEKLRMVATSATRDASNREDFFAMTAEELGKISPGASAEVISGEEEATLSFNGAVSDLDPAEGPFCVIDLGGGSTEFVVGDESGLLGAYSAQMGCVRLTERIMLSDPPTAAEVEIAGDFVRERLAEVQAAVPIAKTKTFVGCAGTFTTLAALALGLEEYDALAIHDSRLRMQALRALANQIISQSSAKRGANPVIHPGRADVLGGGCAVVNGIIDMASTLTGCEEIVISEKDILDGIIARLASERDS